MHRLAAWLLLVWLAFPAAALAYCPPDAVCVDAAMIKTHVGVTRLTLDGGNEPTRIAYGATLGYGSGLFSALIGRNEGFAGQDDLWLDLILGGRSGEPLYYYDLKEGGFAVGMDTGYVLMLGWNAMHWGLFAGTGIKYTTMFVGGSSDFDRSKPYMPLAVRGQLRTGNLLWKAYFYANKTFTRPGVRLDVPIAENFWISASWQRTDQDVAVFNDDNYVYNGHGGSIATIALRSSLMD